MTAKQLQILACQIEFHRENHRIHSGGLEFSDCCLVCVCFVIYFTYFWRWPIIIIFRMNKFVCASMWFSEFNRYSSLVISEETTTMTKRWNSNSSNSLECAVPYLVMARCVLFFFCSSISYKIHSIQHKFFETGFSTLFFSSSRNDWIVYILIFVVGVIFQFGREKRVRIFARFTCHSNNNQ